MKRVFNVILAAALSVLLTSCGAAERNVVEPGADEDLSTAQPQEQASSLDEPETSGESAPEQAEGTAVILTVNGQSFAATLLENESARALAAMLPLTLEMSELNGNEKYFYLEENLPTDSRQPGQINAGDLMLYGDSCLVLFYETFSSSYSYTRLGRVNDPSGLAEALGAGGVTVVFSAAG